MAATHRFAVLVVNQTFTRVKGVARPVLSPATAGGVWEKCVFARVALYWDFWGAAGNKARFAEVLKCDGRFCRWRSEGNVVPFGIEMVCFLVIICFFAVGLAYTVVVVV